MLLAGLREKCKSKKELRKFKESPTSPAKAEIQTSKEIVWSAAETPYPLPGQSAGETRRGGWAERAPHRHRILQGLKHASMGRAFDEQWEERSKQEAGKVLWRLLLARPTWSQLPKEKIACRDRFRITKKRVGLEPRVNKLITETLVVI